MVLLNPALEADEESMWSRMESRKAREKAEKKAKKESGKKRGAAEADFKVPGRHSMLFFQSSHRVATVRLAR